MKNLPPQDQERLKYEPSDPAGELLDRLAPLTITIALIAAYGLINWISAP